MQSFTANPRMLVLIVIFFMSYDDQGVFVLLEAYEQKKRDGLV